MNKKFVSAVIAVLLGVAAFVMISSTVSLIFEAILAQDITADIMENLVSYIRNSAIGIVIFSAAALASYCFTYFTKAKKIFGCISAVLSLALAVFCIAFVFDLRRIALDSTSEKVYTAATAYFSELITIAISALLMCVCFMVVTVKVFTAETGKESISGIKEEEGNETD